MQRQRLVSRLTGLPSKWLVENIRLSAGAVSNRWMSLAWPELESATGRARKRRRRLAKRRELSRNDNAADDDNDSNDSSKHATMDAEIAPQYPKGQPWRVLWPHPHDDPSFVKITKPSRRIPRWKDISYGWTEYMATWEDGIRGIPSPEKLREREAREAAPSSHLGTTGGDVPLPDYDQVRSNVTQNIDVVKESAQDLLQFAKEKTDIHSRDDLQKVVSDMMKLATQCLKEFMAGYREGRDQEIDRMLHEYFREENPDIPTESETAATPQKRQRRKPRRAILR